MTGGSRKPAGSGFGWQIHEKGKEFVVGKVRGLTIVRANGA